jgi:hypothetical protein
MTHLNLDTFSKGILLNCQEPIFGSKSFTIRRNKKSIKQAKRLVQKLKTKDLKPTCKPANGFG